MTNESDSPRKSAFRPLLVILLVVVVLPLLLCGGVVTWFVGRQATAANQLQSRIEELRAEGTPVDNASLQKHFKGLTSDERTERWVDLREIISGETFRSQAGLMPILGDVAPVPPAGEEWEQEQQVLEFLADWKTLRETIHELAEAELDPNTKPLRRPITFTGITTLLPDSQEARGFTRLMALEFDVALRQRDGEAAASAVRAARGLQASFDGEPLLVSQLIRVAIGEITCDMVRRGLEVDLFNAEQLRQIDRQFPTVDDILRAYRMSVQGERAIALPAFTDAETASEFLELEESPAMAGAITKLRSRDGLFFLDEMEKVEAFANEDLKLFFGAGRQWDQDFKQQVAEAGAIERMDKALTFMAMPAYGVAARAMVREAERNRLARLAIATRLFHFREGSWPESVTALVSSAASAGEPVRPLRSETAGDKPFGFRQDGDGVVLWGVDRIGGEEIADEPPVIEGDDDPNAGWVWRVRVTVDEATTP